MEKATYYLVKEIEGRKENGYIAEYSLEKEKPTSVKEGWAVHEIEVEILEELNRFLIKDDSEPYIYGIVEINSNSKSLQNVINAIRGIDGYNTEMLFETIWDIFKGNDIVLPEETLYF